MLLGGTEAASGTEFIHALGFAYAGPDKLGSVLVSVPGTIAKEQPPPPDFVGRQAVSGMDAWCFDRDGGVPKSALMPAARA